MAQSTLQDIISDHKLDMFFPLETSDHFMANVDAFLHNYTRLANLATRDHELLWNIVPKHHWLWHLSRRSKYLNPKRGDTSLDEDFLGHLKHVVSSSSAGTPLHLVSQQVLTKYMWCLHFDLLGL